MKAQIWEEEKEKNKYELFSFYFNWRKNNSFSITLRNNHAKKL